MRCFRHKNGFTAGIDFFYLGEGKIWARSKNPAVWADEDVSDVYSIEDCEENVADGNWVEFDTGVGATNG